VCFCVLVCLPENKRDVQHFPPKNGFMFHELSHGELGALLVRDGQQRRRLAVGRSRTARTMMHATAQNLFGGGNEMEQPETTRANMHAAGCDQTGLPKTTRAIMMHAAGGNLFEQPGTTYEKNACSNHQRQ
jgi:hypothetical protein